MFAQELWIFYTPEIQNHESQQHNLYQIIYNYVKEKGTFFEEFRIFILKIIDWTGIFLKTAKKYKKHVNIVYSGSLRKSYPACNQVTYTNLFHELIVISQWYHLFLS